MECLWCASHSVTHVMPAGSLAITTIGNYSISTSEKWNSRRDPSLAQGHNLEVEPSYAVGKSASRGCTFKTLVSTSPIPAPCPPTPLGPSEVLPFPISQVVKASESCSKVHLKVSSISAVPKEIVPVPC